MTAMTRDVGDRGDSLIEIRTAHAQNGPGFAPAAFLNGRVGRLVSPGSVDFVAEGGDGQVVAQEIAIGGESVAIPLVVSKGLATVSRAGKSYGGRVVVATPVVEDQIHGAAPGVDRHPLEELVVSIVDGIAVHAHRLAPASAVVARGSHEDIHVTVGVIAPRDVKVAALLAAEGIQDPPHPP